MHEAKAGDVAPMSKILDVVAVTGTDDPHGLVLDDFKGLELIVGLSGLPARWDPGIPSWSERGICREWREQGE
jgi:hypothetical protein